MSLAPSAERTERSIRCAHNSRKSRVAFGGLQIIAGTIRDAAWLLNIRVLGGIVDPRCQRW